MLWNFVIALGLVVHTSHSCTVLESTHSQVLMNVTDNVTITCRYECQDPGQELMEEAVFSINIYKEQNKTLEASYEIRLDDNITYPVFDPETGVTLDGHISNVSQSFLSMTWLKASHDTSGQYGCVITVEEITGLPASLVTNLLVIVDPLTNVFRMVTTNLKRMENMVESLESRILVSERQIEKLKSRRVDRSYYETREWPRGKYALFNTLDGCPKSSTSDWQPGHFVVITTYDAIQLETHKLFNYHYPDIFFNVHYLNPARSTHSLAVEGIFSMCRRRGSGGPAWPIGSYCIYRYGRKCPEKFRHGAVQLGHGIEKYPREAVKFAPKMKLRAPDVRFTVNYTIINFCCRRDGDHDVPIRLPVSKPFYLYRYQGECQRVRNANVTEEAVVLQTRDNKYLNSVRPDSTFIYGSARFNLCYYEPLD